MLELGLDFIIIEGLLVEPGPDNACILDFVPAIAAESFTVERSLVGGEISSDVWQSAVFTFRVTTPWGVRQQELVGNALGVLTLIDGQKTAHEIYGEVVAQHGHMDPAEFVQILSGLRRTRVIDFHTSMSAPGDLPTDGLAGNLTEGSKLANFE
jgi:hypothetical protein